MEKPKLFFFALLSFCMFLGAKTAIQTNDISTEIRLNQIGYYPNATKRAIVVNSSNHKRFQIINIKEKKSVFEGILSEKKDWTLSGETVRIANFSELNEPGNYQVHIDGLGNSYPFEIKKMVLRDALLGSIKGLYYQRCSMALSKEHAGKWYREMGHPDVDVFYHESSGKKEGFKTSSKGWYDAGDYNKYVINGSFPMGQFLLLQKQYPSLIKDNDLNIPESGNGISDYLDELKYELDWLLTMQDEDGGLFHKLTTKSFEGMVMPDKAISQRYIVGKGTAATLDFSAAMAHAHRIFKTVDGAYANLCLEASKKAYDWAVKNPNVVFQNPADIHTGQYGDRDFTDEKFWASVELFISTKDDYYLHQADKLDIEFIFKPGESWTTFMRFLGIFSLLDNKETISKEKYLRLQEGILLLADELVIKSENGNYLQPIDDFHWGSNSDILNAAMIMAQAYRLNPKREYLKSVQQAADYVLGNNATGYSYVTGFGQKTPQFIHHRQSAADDIDEPVPGLLSGGPNSRQQDVKDGTIYPKNSAPMKSWVDQESSYASNEICLNWNAPLTYILGFLEAEAN
jgi:endoglucanase